MGSGVQWDALYQYADDEGVIVVGGDCGLVGAGGGWLLGGGHSVLSPTFGMGVDNLLEVQIVTADGLLKTANKCVNSELFWYLLLLFVLVLLDLTSSLRAVRGIV